MIKENPDGSIYSTEGFWLPRICQKQYEIFDCSKRYVLCTGPRKSGKTIGVLHRVVRHAYDNSFALIGIVTRTIKNAKAGGVWNDLTEIILPEWFNANIGIKYTQPPKVSGDARLNSLKIRNRHGTESEIQLHSIEYEWDVIPKFKGTRFSMFFFSELDTFRDRVVFDISSDQLRSFTVPYDQLQFISDCNPDTPSHWAYQLWFKERAMENHPNPKFQSNICRIDCTIDDNKFLTEDEKAELKAKYSYRKTLYNKFVLGLWEEDMEGSHFSDVFRPDVHVMGDANKGERICPSPGCLEQAEGSGCLITGWDPGEVNHAFVVIEKLEWKDEKGDTITKFGVIDELLVLARKIPLRNFVEGALDIIEKIEDYCLRTYKKKPRWQHYSDSSAFRFKSAAESTDELLVREISRGKVNLAAAPKYRNSVRDRVKLVHQLLREERLFFSGQCQNCLESIRMLRKGDSQAEYVMINDYKHMFDALSYGLVSVAPVDMVLNNDFRVGRLKPHRGVIGV